VTRGAYYGRILAQLTDLRGWRELAVRCWCPGRVPTRERLPRAAWLPSAAWLGALACPRCDCARVAYVRERGFSLPGRRARKENAGVPGRRAAPAVRHAPFRGSILRELPSPSGSLAPAHPRTHAPTHALSPSLAAFICIRIYVGPVWTGARISLALARSPPNRGPVAALSRPCRWGALPPASRSQGSLGPTRLPYPP
jgi:hypothetical protein